MNWLEYALAAALTLAFAPTSWSAGQAELSQARQRYRHERMLCLSSHSRQDRAACLSQAAASYRQARRGDPANEGIPRNPAGGCDAQPDPQRQACILRILGAGSIEGAADGSSSAAGLGERR